MVRPMQLARDTRCLYLSSRLAAPIVHGRHFWINSANSIRSIISFNLGNSSINCGNLTTTSNPSRKIECSLLRKRSFIRSFHSSDISRIKDPYSTLGVSKSSDKRAIKKAYFALAKQYHPDTNKDSAAKVKFVEVQHAYDILTDPKKKEILDQYGPAVFDDSGEINPNFGAQAAPGGPGASGGFAGSASGFPGFGGFGGFGGGGFGPGGINLEDLFGAFTGAGGRASRSRSPFEILVGDDLEISLNIEFMEAAKGTSKSVKVNPLTQCYVCSGSGLKKGKSLRTCTTCNGTGHKVHIMQGGFQMASTCEACGGVGSSIAPGDACSSCHGEGIVRKLKTITIDIPAGIEDGMKLKVSGEGDAAPTVENPKATMRPGDLYVRVKVALHPTFKRRGADVIHTQEIPMTTAALGGKVSVPTLDGSSDVRIKPGTNSGDSILMSGKGMKRLDSRFMRGDFRIEFKVVTPRNLSPYEQQLLEQFATSRGEINANYKSSWIHTDARQFPSESKTTAPTSTSSTSDKGHSQQDSDTSPKSDDLEKSDTQSSEGDGSKGGFFKRLTRKLHEA